MFHGVLPKEVDHINGNTTDNRIENLRVASHAENMRNCKIQARNTSGAKGVYWNKATQKYTASIRVDGVLHHLGTFSNFADAVSVRKQSAESNHREFCNHG